MIRKILIMLPLLLMVSFQAEAAEPEAIELKSVSEVEISVANSQGEMETTRVEAAMAHIEPGDTVIFTNYYSNNGDKPMDDVVLVNPVPEHMTYVADTAEGEGTNIEFSVDQGRSYDLPGNLKVKDEEGKERGAAAADYTHIRWTFAGPVNKGDAGRVSFKATVK